MNILKKMRRQRSDSLDLDMNPNLDPECSYSALEFCYINIL